MSKNLLNYSTTSSDLDIGFELPTSKDEFLTKLGDILASLEWNELEGTSKRLSETYGKHKIVQSLSTPRGCHQNLKPGTSMR